MSLRFEQVRLPLADFDLRLDLSLRGPVTAIVGPSGSGKTSLLELVAGLRRPVEGRVSISDSVLADAASGFAMPPRERGIGYLTQDDTLFPHLSVERNLTYGVSPEAAGGVRGVADALGISPLLGRLPARLSGGERRRVALGRALLAARRMILLDEPLTGLNAELRSAALALIGRWRTERAIPMLYVTHVPEEAAALTDEVLELRDGEIVRREGAR